MSVSLPRSLLLLVACAAAACAQPRDDGALAEPGCSVRVIVTLQAAPDDALVADLARVSRAQLELVRTMTSNLHLFALTAAGSESRVHRGDRAVAARPTGRRSGYRSTPRDPVVAVSVTLTAIRGARAHAHEFVRCGSVVARGRRGRARRSPHATAKTIRRCASPLSAADLGDTPGMIVKFRSGTSARVQAQAAGDAVSKLAARGFAIRDARALPAGLHAAQGRARCPASRSRSNSRACARTPRSNSRSPIGAGSRTHCRAIRSTPASGICRTASTRRARCTRKPRGIRAPAMRVS